MGPSLGRRTSGCSGARERIFKPYQRAHHATGLQGSIGSGLSVSRQLARLMGGDLTYRYEAGHSVFELSLPLAEKVLVAGAEPVESSIG